MTILGELYKDQRTDRCRIIGTGYYFYIIVIYFNSLIISVFYAKYEVDYKYLNILYIPHNTYHFLAVYFILKA